MRGFFKELPLNIKQKFEFSCHLIDGKRLLSVVVGAVRFSADKPLDFHDTTFSVSFSLFKAVEVLNKAPSLLK